ncbi:hypothetical protein Taro_042231 [Colocasia esculenta]|uniref:Uncharacterized protein n=1 Tax=Colocasia esculenta TaxID=4460 RepID=A0A843X260_COLES|nr:hypothetical protein [Colocasia esculenta]
MNGVESLKGSSPHENSSSLASPPGPSIPWHELGPAMRVQLDSKRQVIHQNWRRASKMQVVLLRDAKFAAHCPHESILELIAAVLPRLHGDGQVSAEEQVPGGEVVHRVVGLRADVLVVEGVEGGVVGHPPVDGVVGEPHSAMVVQPLEREQAEEDCGRPGGHTADEDDHEAAEDLPHDGVHRVDVLRSIGIGNDHVVVHGVDVLVQEFVLVRPTVPEVLPTVHEQRRHSHLPNDSDKRRRPCSG